MTIIAIVGLILSGYFAILLIQYREEHGALIELKDQVEQKRTDFIKLSETNELKFDSIQKLIERESQFNSEINHMQAHKEQVLEELDRLLKENNSATESINNKCQQINDLNYQISQLENTLHDHEQKIKIQNEKIFAEEEKDLSDHFINLPQNVFKDIAYITEAAKNLSSPQPFFKVIWSEYIQKPTQEMCKRLKVDGLSGIYRITNRNNQMSYIGQSTNIGDRWKAHIKAGLGINVTSFNKFYKALNTEGVWNFSFEVLEIAEPSKLKEKEKYWIDFCDTVNHGYNSKAGG